MNKLLTNVQKGLEYHSI